MKRTLILLLILPLSFILAAQQLTVDWEKLISGSKKDILNSVAETKDNNFLVGGYSYSYDGDMKMNNSSGSYCNIWIFKIDISGKILWKNYFTSLSHYHLLHEIVPTDNGFFLICTAKYYTLNELLIIKIDQNGNQLWRNSVDFTSNTVIEVNKSVLDVDGNLLVTTKINGKDDGDFDAGVVKLKNENGDIIFEKIYGGNLEDVINEVISLNDGSYMLLGTSQSMNININGRVNLNNVWILHTDKNGNVINEKSLGPDDKNTFKHVIRHNSDEFFVVAQTSNKWITGNTDILLYKINSNCDVLMEKTYGGSGNEIVLNIIPNKFGYSILCGTTSSDGDIFPRPDNTLAFWSLAIDQSGNKLDQHSFINPEIITGITQFNREKSEIIISIINWDENLNYVLYIQKISTDGEIKWTKIINKKWANRSFGLLPKLDHYFLVSSITNNNNDDMWIAKLSESEITDTNPQLNNKEIKVYPNPVNEQINIDFQSTNVQQVELYHPNGQLLYCNHPTENHEIIPMINISSGIYLLKIILDDETIITKKIIK